MSLDAKFAAFLGECLVQTPNATLPRATLRSQWSEYNNGSAGINKLYKYIEENLTGLTKTHLTGYSIKNQATPLPPAQSPLTPPIQATPLPPAQSPLTPPIQATPLPPTQSPLTPPTQSPLEPIGNENMSESAMMFKLMMYRMDMDAQSRKDANDIARETLEVTKDLGIRRLDLEERKHQEFIRQKQLDREHHTAENNKNRRLFQHGIHPYLDYEVYGNVAHQYITSSSLKRNLLANVLIHDVSDPTRERDICNVINTRVNQETSELPIVVKSDANDVMLVDDDLISINDCVEIASDVANELHDTGCVANRKNEWIDTMSKRVAIVKSVKTKDDLIVSAPTHIDTLEIINAGHIGSSKKNKRHYLKPRNKVKMVDNNPDDLMVCCYVCANPCSIKDASLHRSHNLPESKGGSWNKQNIYLCCSKCNLNMGNGATIEEYSCSLIENKLNELTISFTKRKNDIQLIESSDTASDSGSEAYLDAQN